MADEVISIINELEVLLHQCTETQSIKEAKEFKDKLHDLRQKRDAEMKKAIAAVLEEKDEAESKCEMEMAEEERKLSEILSALKGQYQDISSHKAAVETQVQKLQHQVNCGRVTASELEEKRSAIRKKTEVDLPIERLTSKLYRTVSNIQWQLDSDEIKGMVLNSKAVKSFSLNKKKQSSFFVSNYLWDLIENEWDETT